MNPHPAMHKTDAADNISFFHCTICSVTVTSQSTENGKIIVLTTVKCRKIKICTQTKSTVHLQSLKKN